MSIAIQKGFWRDQVIADTRDKLVDLYSRNPDVFDNPKQVILAFWREFEGLDPILEDKLRPFIDWFKSSTSPETVTRYLRSLKEEGTIKQAEDDKNLGGNKNSTGGHSGAVKHGQPGY